MHLQHMALPSKDVLAHQQFYMSYFGFSPVRGPGFLLNAEGFVLVLDPSENPKMPDAFHVGFQTSANSIRELYHKMVENAVPIDQQLADENGMLSFYCRDPAGIQVEVRHVPERGA
jgi:catechol-2,3-dioxygenase